MDTPPGCGLPLGSRGGGSHRVRANADAPAAAAGPEACCWMCCCACVFGIGACVMKRTVTAYSASDGLSWIHGRGNWEQMTQYLWRSCLLLVFPCIVVSVIVIVTVIKVVVVVIRIAALPTRHHNYFLSGRCR